MEENKPNQFQNPPENKTEMDIGKNKKTKGPIITILVIILVLLLAGYWIMGERGQEPEPVEEPSDEVEDIEADLALPEEDMEEEVSAGEAELELLEQELEEIEAEFNELEEDL